jgi:hypothetical protein
VKILLRGPSALLADARAALYRAGHNPVDSGEADAVLKLGTDPPDRWERECWRRGKPLWRSLEQMPRRILQDS